jgi:Signal recognition particle 9 kDa protein (SRP9)
MVFAKSWEDFEIAAEAMLMENPEKCRYSMKYAHTKQTLILKVTNNAKVSETRDFPAAQKCKLSLYSLLVHTIQNRNHARLEEN